MNQPDNYTEVALQELHSRLAARPNASTATMEAGKQLGVSLPQALILALGTLGGKHAPIRQCFDLMSRRDGDFDVAMNDLVDRNQAVPGFGSSFVKDQPDPLIEAFANENLTPSWKEEWFYRTQLVQIATGANIYPNAAMATVYAALATCNDAGWAEAQFVLGRIKPWIWTYEGTQG